MPSRFIAHLPVVAYASTAKSNPNHGGDFKLLRRWSFRVPFQMDTLAEEIHPGESHRPLWGEILSEIERGAITTLVVPSLFHIAGDDFISLSKVLTFLEVHGVTLKSLTELIDSRRDSRNEIILRLVDDSRKQSENRGDK